MVLPTGIEMFTRRLEVRLFAFAYFVNVNSTCTPARSPVEVQLYPYSLRRIPPTALPYQPVCPWNQ